MTTRPTPNRLSAEKTANRNLAIDLARFTRALEEIERKRGGNRDESAPSLAVTEARIQRCLDSIDRCYDQLGSEEIATFDMPRLAMPNVAMTEPASYAGCPICSEVSTIAESATDPIARSTPGEPTTERFYRVTPNTGPRRPTIPSEQQTI